jgi:FKBP-type peptidyl-prolyl cis-trans isomerase SlyD
MHREENATGARSKGRPGTGTRGLFGESCAREQPCRLRGRGPRAVPSTRFGVRATCAGTVSDLTIQPNTHVTIDYELRDEEGDLLDASEGEEGEPIRYVHGYGMLVPGLEAALAGLRMGDEREVVVPADAGYGEYDESLVLDVERSQLPDPKGVAVGDEFVAESPDGDEVAMCVLEVYDDRVVVDANHPLAGMTLRYSVKIREVRQATSDEIEHAAAELDEAHEHVHGPDCDHDHDEAPVPLGRRDVN